MFKITVDQEIQGASIWVRWCLDQETKEILEKRAAAKVRLLLIITGGDPHKEYRALVPLENVVEILPARYPGKNTIFSAIVWDRTTRDLKETYLRRDKERDEYHWSAVSYPDEYAKDETPAFTRYWDDSWGLKGPIIEVEVPKEIFAEEPPKWEKEWVNTFFKRPAFDQCEFRKRRIFAYTIQPIIFLIMFAFIAAIVIAVSLGALLVGFYKFDFRRLGFGEEDIHPSAFVPEREKNYWYLLWHRLFPRREKKPEVVAFRRQVEEQGRIAALNRIYETLKCDSGIEKPSPPLSQRIHLSYHDLKDKVCKPFAG